MKKIFLIIVICLSFKTAQSLEVKIVHIIQNEIIERIKTRSNEAKEAGSVRNIVFKTVPYSMPVIRMNRDDLYYNLENDRTLSKTKEFTVKTVGV